MTGAVSAIADPAIENGEQLGKSLCLSNNRLRPEAANLMQARALAPSIVSSALPHGGETTGHAALPRHPP